MTEIEPAIYSGISIKRTPLVQKKCLLYRDIHFIEIFSKVVWPQNKAIRSHRTVCLIRCPLYGDFTVFQSHVLISIFIWMICFKGTLLQIWKSPYMFVFIWKYYPKNFALLIPRILKLFTRGVCIFLKK